MITTTRRETAQRTRILTMECLCCEADTPHALTSDGKEYVCGFCGNCIERLVNHAKPMRAMDLRESPEAQERFNDWCDEQ